MKTVRRLASACLEHPINDPSDRNIMPMSTLIASEQWLLETSWDGSSIGDIQIFKNISCGQNGAKLPGLQDNWAWWGGVPNGRITSYRFLDVEIEPQTVTPDLPFEVPDAQRKAKPDQAGARGAAAT